MLEGFSPIISKKPRILILGSMPSVTSLDKQEYYAFKHNRFWKIMSNIYHMPITTYEEKKEIIYINQLILWDVIHTCEREGSLDSKIKHEQVNPIDELFHTYPTIQRVLCNGKKSYQLYQKHFSHLPIECISLPSTSNANRTIKEEALFQMWKDALMPYKKSL